MILKSGRIAAGVPILLAAVGATLALVAASQANTPVSQAVLDQASRVSGKQGVALERAPGSPGEVDLPVDQLRDIASHDTYWVEKGSGEVRYFSDREAYNRPRGSAVSQDVVLQNAAAVVPRFYSPDRLAKMTTQIELRDHGTMKDYVVDYTEHIGGVRTFNYVRLAFAEDGVLLNVEKQEAEVTVPLTPEIAADSAVAVLAKANGLTKWSGQKTELVVHRAPSGEQRLCWEVELRTGDDSFGTSFRGRVDALTGALLNSATTG